MTKTINKNNNRNQLNYVLNENLYICFYEKNTHLIIYPFAIGIDIFPLCHRHLRLVSRIPLNLYSRIKSETKTTTQVDPKNESHS